MDIVKLLIEKDADVHAKTHGGKTALHGAVVQKRDEVINILLVRPNPTESLARALLKLGLFCCAPGRRGADKRADGLGRRAAVRLGSKDREEVGAAGHHAPTAQVRPLMDAPLLFQNSTLLSIITPKNACIGFARAEATSVCGLQPVGPPPPPIR